MTRTQHELLELLKRVACFLEENSITYYLFGGTAIGALRHRGFIPWDDDIDILMDRDNYYRLIEASASLPDDIEFDCFELDHRFAKPYGMFSKKTDTATSRSRMYWGGVCMGSAIDVFLTDDVPEEKLEEHTKNIFLYQELMVDAWLYKTDIVRYRKEYLELMERRQRIGKPALMDELKAKLEQYTYEESDRRVVRVSGGSPLRKYLKEWIGEPVYREFEGLRMPLQTWPEACLRMQYGYDWYLIPEPDKRTHHVQITNYDVSYNNYYKDISRFIDWDKADEINRKRKVIDVDRLDNWLAVEGFNNELIANALLMRSDLDNKAEIPDEIAGNIRLIIKAGCGKGCVAQDVLSAWMEKLILAGRYWDARRFRQAFCDEECAEGALKDTLALLDKVMKLAEHWQDHRAEACKEALMAIPEDMRYLIPDCLVAEEWLMEQGQLHCDRESLMVACDRYLKQFPDNYEIMKVKADLLIACGDKDAGENLYHKVLEGSRNGLDLLYIGDYFSGKMGNRIS